MTFRIIIVLALAIFGMGLIIRFNSYEIEATRNIELMKEKVRKLSVQNDLLKKDIILKTGTDGKSK